MVAATANCKKAVKTVTVKVKKLPATSINKLNNPSGGGYLGEGFRY